MKYVIFGGFDHAVYYEMDQAVIRQGIDYFVDNDPKLIGTTYLGKPIKHPSALLEENKKELLILIGSVVYRTEIAFQLKEMGFKEETDYIWALAFTGDERCRRLWQTVEWKDRETNAKNLSITEHGEYPLARMKTALKLVNIKAFDTVIDLGAANERLRTLLPSDIRYIPVDYTRYSVHTVLCDFNAHEFPEIKWDIDKACIFSIGCINHCKDWKWYLRKITESCSCLILAHDEVARVNREYRTKHWTRHNALFDYEIIIYLQSLGFKLTNAVDFRLKSICYKFERS